MALLHVSDTSINQLGCNGPEDERPLVHDGCSSAAGNSEHPASSDKEKDGCHGLSCRYTVAVMCFLGIFCSMNCRMCFNMALVAMVNYTSINANVSTDSCPLPGNSTEPQHHKEWTGEQFEWPDWTQSLMLSAHYYGYILTQVPGGYLAQRIGGKTVLAASVLVPSALCLLIPTLAHWNWYAVVVVRVLIGLAQGPLASANSVLIGRWAPRLENSRLYNLSNCGFNVAGMVSSVLTGYLCGQDFLGGWPAAFYLFGSLGFLWVVPWYFLVYSSPDVHPRISQEEKILILKSTHITKNTRHQTVPWLMIFTSKAVWAVFLYYLFDGIASYCITTGLPFYLKLMLHYDMSANGMLNALPQLCYSIGQLAGGYIADAMRRYISTRSTRKILSFIGSGTAAVVVLAMSLVMCDHMLPVALFSASCIITAIGWSGAAINHLDIAPMYTGVLMGIANSLSNIGGCIAPTILSGITHMQADRADWRLFFYVTCGLSVCSLLSYLILGEGELQPWARPQDVEVDVTINSSTEADNLGERPSHEDIATVESRSIVGSHA